MTIEEEIRAIEERHAITQDMIEEHSLHGAILLVHADRGALLSFVRRLAEMDPIHRAPDEYDTTMHDECSFCGGDEYESAKGGDVKVGTVYHGADCLWLIAQEVTEP